MNTNKTRIVFALAILCMGLPAFAADKSIYIKPFAVVQGMPATDTAGSLVKDYISEAVIEKGGYIITSDDEVKQVIEQEELKMSLSACYDDACIRKLMESIRTDFIIYGTISNIENKYYLTAKILDRTSGTVKLARVKTLKFVEREMMEQASRALGNFLITGNNSAVQEFEDMERERARTMGERLPYQPESRRESITSRASLLRAGWGYAVLTDTVLNEYCTNTGWGTGVFDIFLWRQRAVSGKAFDFFMRGTFAAYPLREEKKDATRDKSMLDGDPIAFTPLKDGGLVMFMQLSWGARYITGWYAKGILWQLYISAAYKLVAPMPLASEELGDSEKADDENAFYRKDFTAHGFVAGIGMELGIFANIGVFVEMTAGYCPVGDKKRNVEGVSFLGGATFRTKMWRF